MENQKFKQGLYIPTKEELKYLDEWMEELRNNSFFPFHVVEEYLESPYNNVFFIHGIMDDGKSFKHWQYNMAAYLRKGEITQVLFPETDAMKEEMNKFLEDFIDQCPKLWGNVEVITLNSRGTQYAVLYRKHIMCYVNSIGTLKKTARINRIKRIVIDEYNQHSTRIRNEYVDKYNILLSRNMRSVKKIFMGNNVTTDHVLLHRYNIYELPDDIRVFPIENKDENGKWYKTKFNVIVWNFKRDKNSVYEKYKDIGEYYELNMVDFGAHAFFNESKNDNRDFIVDLDKNLNKMTLKFLIQSRIGVLEVYRYIFLGEWYYYIRYDKKTELKLGDYRDNNVLSYVLHKDFEESGYNESREMNSYFYELKGHKRHIYRYQNASVANAFQSQLNRHI